MDDLGVKREEHDDRMDDLDDQRQDLGDQREDLRNHASDRKETGWGKPMQLPAGPREKRPIGRLFSSDPIK